MTVAVSTLLGRPVWFELMTTDTKAPKRSTTRWSAGRQRHSTRRRCPTRSSRERRVPVAGLMTRPDDMNMPPFWAMYVSVPKLEDAVAHIKRLGGSELSPVIDMPTVGRMQMVKDPQGAAFYIIQPARPDASRRTRRPEVGEASWLELMTTDAPAAMTFYQEVFGWQPSEAMDMGPMGKYQMFNRGDRMIGGMMNKPPEMAQVPPQLAIYFRVPDINAATERIKANGGRSSTARWRCPAVTGS